MKYRTKGVCSSFIEIELDERIIESVSFVGGCSGNLQGISRLVKGMKAEDAIGKLKGITCDYRSTSCPDQLANALMAMVSNK